MAKLTESYLRNMIKQVMNEMYQQLPLQDNVADAVDAWRVAGDYTLQEFADEHGAEFGGVTKQQMLDYLAEEDKAMAAEPEFDYDMLESRNRTPRRK